MNKEIKILSLRIPADVYEEIRHAAGEELRSINSYIVSTMAKDLRVRARQHARRDARED